MRLTTLQEKITSGIVTGLAGALFGYWISLVLDGFFIVPMYLIILATGIASIVLDYYNPVLMETLSFVFSAWILFQIAWDFPNGDRTASRLILGGFGLGLLILNSLTGKLRFGTGKKVIRRALGLR